MEGSIICILFGLSVSVILRKCSEGGYNLVGKCYLHEVMDGEASYSKRTLLEKEETSYCTNDGAYINVSRPISICLGNKNYESSFLWLVLTRITSGRTPQQWLVLLSPGIV